MTLQCVRSTETFYREDVYDTHDTKTDDQGVCTVRANHINALGRSKPLFPVGIAPCSYTTKNNFDFTDLDMLENETSLFDIAAWIENRNSNSSSYEYKMYDDVLSLLWDSPTARSLINFAAEKQWRINMEQLEDAAYDLDHDWQILSLNNFNLKFSSFEKTGYFRHTLLLALIKGLRDIWHIECRQPYEHGLSIESVLLLERVRAADCDVIALLTAWELRSEGNPEIWRHIIGAPEGDMALSFSRALEREPGRFFDGSAPVEAFHQWFENRERVAACDHQTLDMIDYHLSDARESGLYAKKRPKPQYVESLSRLPDKSHYLRTFGFAILKDPHFSGLEDEVNQAYYLQIKREMDSTTIGAVAFRDAELAAKIFPQD